MQHCTRQIISHELYNSCNTKCFQTKSWWECNNLLKENQNFVVDNTVLNSKRQEFGSKSGKTWVWDPGGSYTKNNKHYSLVTILFLVCISASFGDSSSKSWCSSIGSKWKLNSCSMKSPSCGNLILCNTLQAWTIFAAVLIWVSTCFRSSKSAL